MSNSEKALATRYKNLANRSKQIAAGVVVTGLSAAAAAEPVTFTLTDASAQITAGATVLAGVVGTIAAVAAVMKIGRWVIGFFR